MNLTLMAVVSGVFFGAWPLIMNRSHLDGIAASACLAAILFVVIAPIAWSRWDTIGQVRWGFVIAASLCSSIGILCFNYMLSHATAKSVSTLFVTMIIVQTLAAASYHVVMNGSVSLYKGLGFVLAGLSAWLLFKK